MDGTSHINIYSHGTTSLGRFLSNFHRQRIKLPEGTFQSIEGYWYFLGSGDDRLKYLSGFAAKKLGRTLTDETNYIDDILFKEKIKKAIRKKIVESDYLKEFVESVLPFRHYYQMKNKTIELPQFQWIVDFITDLREDLKKEKNVLTKYKIPDII